MGAESRYLMKNMRVASAGVVLVACLAGCTTSPAYSDLARSSTDKDVLPSDMSSAADLGLDEREVRFVTEVDDAQVFLAPSETAAVCVVIYRNADAWTSQCGGAPLTVAYKSLELTIASDNASLGKEWQAISKNVYQKVEK